MKNFTKAVISVALAAAVSLPFSANIFAVDYLGDVNGDSEVNSSDALAVLNYAVGNSDENFILERADLNTDGSVNSADALEILKTSVGMVEKVEIGAEKTPLDFDKAEIVDYYNQALKSAYASESLTLNKKTGFSNVKISSFSPSSLMGTVNELIEKELKDTNETQSFNGDAASAEKFLVPTSLEADGVKNAEITETENGYEISITLVGEKVDYKTAPKYNAQASVPVTGLADMATQNSIKVKSSELNYTGTVITAEVDKAGKIISLKHFMPVNVKASASYSIFSINGSGSVEYSLSATFDYNN